MPKEDVRLVDDLTSTVLVTTLLADGGDGHPVNLSLELDTNSSLQRSEKGD